MQGIGNLIGRSIPPTGLDRFNPFSQLGTKMSGNILSKINEGGEAVRDDSGMIVGVVHDGLLGGRVYTGRPGFNPFALPVLNVVLDIFTTRTFKQGLSCITEVTLVSGYDNIHTTSFSQLYIVPSQPKWLGLFCRAYKGGRQPHDCLAVTGVP